MGILRSIKWPDLTGPDVLTEPGQIVLALIIFAWVFRYLIIALMDGDAITDKDDDDGKWGDSR